MLVAYLKTLISFTNQNLVLGNPTYDNLLIRIIYLFLNTTVVLYSGIVKIILTFFVVILGMSLTRINGILGMCHSII
jgi:hypothetical protein